MIDHDKGPKSRHLYTCDTCGQESLVLPYGGHCATSTVNENGTAFVCLGQYTCSCQLAKQAIIRISQSNPYT